MWVNLLYEDDIVLVSPSCLVLRNRCIELHDYNDYNEMHVYCLNDLADEIVSIETQDGKRQRDALMFYYILSNQVR